MRWSIRILSYLASIHIYNKLPAKRSTKSAHELWTGQKSDDVKNAVVEDKTAETCITSGPMRGPKPTS